MISSSSKCFLCKGSNTPTISAGNLVYKYQCQTCGTYTITRALIDDGVSNNTNEPPYIIQGVTRFHSERGQPANLTPENLTGLVDSARPAKGVSEQMDCFLLYIANKQKSADEDVQIFFERSYPVAFAKHGNELKYLADSLREQNLLRSRSHKYPDGADEFYRLTPSGWKAVDELRRIRPDSDQAFVAMAFTGEMQQIYEKGIKPALVNTGLRPFLVNEPYYDGRIDDLIIAEIRRSGFLIADFTGHRPNVYFEVGLAMGLGVHVIRICKESDINDLHFDQRQYRCTSWKSAEDLRNQLENHIGAVR